MAIRKPHRYRPEGIKLGKGGALRHRSILADNSRPKYKYTPELIGTLRKVHAISKLQPYACPMCRGKVYHEFCDSCRDKNLLKIMNCDYCKNHLQPNEMSCVDMHHLFGTHCSLCSSLYNPFEHSDIKDKFTYCLKPSKIFICSDCTPKANGKVCLMCNKESTDFKMTTNLNKQIMTICRSCDDVLVKIKVNQQYHTTPESNDILEELEEELEELEDESDSNMETDDVEPQSKKRKIDNEE